MSTLYLGTDAELLANRLARHLDQSARTRDFFAPTTVVVPQRSLGKWLKLWLARHQGIAANLRVLYFEESLWEMHREIDPRPQDPAPELLDSGSYSLLVLSILTESRRAASVSDRSNPGLEFWHTHLGDPNDSSRLYCRRLWHLADQLAVLVRDYEYHRQDALIQHWLKDELGLPAEHANLERAQQAIFKAITHEPDGKRAILNQAWKRNFKTLPQYAMEVMDHFEANKLPFPAVPLRTLHLFGMAQFSLLHANVLRWLGRFFDLHLYHANPLAGRLPPRPNRAALLRLAHTGERRGVSPTCTSASLLHTWGHASAESLATMAQLLNDSKAFHVELLATPARETASTDAALFDAGQRPTVLARLQDQLLRGETHSNRLPQDRSLQIVGCPGMIREVETVYNSILANLQERPDLKQSDIAVFVTDMDRYRPILQGVFERQPKRLRYNLSVFTAAGISTLAQGVVGMLDLALDAFTRSKVCAVLLNPCFLARLGVDRTQALVWLEWVRELGIYQGWDQADKKERGHADSPLFAWQLGLRRLRLGRIMEVGRDDALEPLPRFGPVVPFADVNASDPEKLNAFCLAVEGLLPRLGRLRHVDATAGAWVALLEGLLDDFLQVPEDRPEEAQVLDRLRGALKKWLLWDHLGAEPRRMRLALVFEMVRSVLEGIEGRQGEFLTGGVTLAGLQLVKPIPVRIVYILGLGEDLFPGNNALPGLDLRAIHRLPGDIRPAEYNRNLLLEALLSARDKLYLLYQNLDAQRDQVLHPCVPLQQLKRSLRENILDADFSEATVPLVASDENLLQPLEEAASADVRVQYGEVDRLLALDGGQRGGLVLGSEQQAEIAGRFDKRRGDFALARVGFASLRPLSTLTLTDLRKYLEFPASTAVKYHLHLQDDEDDELSEDEPFVTNAFASTRLMRQTLQQVVLEAMRTDVAQSLQEWQERFTRVYEEWGLRGQVPEEAFGEVDRAALLVEIGDRITGSSGLEGFLDEHPGRTFCGPILIGESVTPIGARQCFPALKLPWGRHSCLPNTREPSNGRQECLPHDVRLVGSMPLAWRDETALEILTWKFKKETTATDKALFKFLLEPVLFYLALRAGDEGSPSSREWLGERIFRVHIGHAGGIASFEYLPEDVNPEQARAYLTELAADFLDPACFDLLPLEKLLEKTFADAFMRSDTKLGKLPEDYQQMLEDSLGDDLDSPWNHWSSPLIELVQPHVPADAFAKVRRRFRLIDQGPRRNRENKKTKSDADS